jgi:hypothetical protein
LLVSALTPQGASLFIVDTQAAGVELNPSRTVDGFRVADVAFSNVSLHADALLGADGAVETITGTTIHPVWSVDRQEWVPLAELAQGERLQGLDGLAVVLGVSLARVSQPVYNIEVHGEHVYQVGELGLVVHIDDVANLFASTPGHAGTHTLALVDCLIDVMIDRHSTESMISYPVSLGF